MNGIHRGYSTYGTFNIPTDTEIFGNSPQPQTSALITTTNPQPASDLKALLLRWVSRVWSGAPRPPVMGFEVLPTSIIEIIGNQTGNPALMRTSKEIYTVLQDVYKDRLNQACLTNRGNFSKKASVLYANPANRLDKFVPLDKAGEKYLKDRFGIRPEHKFLISQIKKGLPIEAAAKTVQKNRQLIARALSQGGDNQLIMLHNPALVPDIECGLLTLDHLSQLSGYKARAFEEFYGEEAIRDYLEKGELRMEDIFNPRYQIGLRFLSEYPEIQPYINARSIKALLRIDKNTSFRLQMERLDRWPEKIKEFIQ